MTLGETIKSLRKKKGWKQYHLAERVNTTYETISAIERGKRVPKAELLSALSRELGTTVDFLTGEDPRFKKISKSKTSNLNVPDVNSLLRSVYELRLQGKVSLEQILRAALGIFEK